LIPGFQTLSSYRGFSQRDAFGKTHAWVASPEERRAGDPKTNPFIYQRSLSAAPGSVKPKPKK